MKLDNYYLCKGISESTIDGCGGFGRLCGTCCGMATLQKLLIKNIGLSLLTQSKT